MRIEARHNTGQSGPRNRPPRHTSSRHHSTYLNVSLFQDHHNGKHGHSSPRDCICCCIFVCIVIPMVLIIIGLVTLNSENNRVERIEKCNLSCYFMCSYNSRAKEWNDKYASLFKDASFLLNDMTPMNLTTRSSKYFPVADACSSDGDPEGGCVSTVSYSFHSTLSIVGDSVSVSIRNSNDSILYSDTKDAGYFVVYDQNDMNCDPDEDDSESSSCYRKCISMNGEYDDWSVTCKVAYSLVGICIRVVNGESAYELSRNS